MVTDFSSAVRRQKYTQNPPLQGAFHLRKSPCLVPAGSVSFCCKIVLTWPQGAFLFCRNWLWLWERPQEEQNIPWGSLEYSQLQGQGDLQTAQTQGEVTLLTNMLWIQVHHRMFYLPWEQGKKSGWSSVISIKFTFLCNAKELYSHSEICLIKPLYDVH